MKEGINNNLNVVFTSEEGGGEWFENSIVSITSFFKC